MSVLAIFRWRGDPDSLIAAADKEPSILSPVTGCAASFTYAQGRTTVS